MLAYRMSLELSLVLITAVLTGSLKICHLSVGMETIFFLFYKCYKWKAFDNLMQGFVV